MGQELRVGRLLQGHFMKQGEMFTVTLEATDVATDRLLWENTVTQKADNLIELQGQLKTQIQRGLFTGSGRRRRRHENASAPKNQEAYDLYLRSVAQAHDPKPNKEAIKTLEWAVAIDPTYSPAWEALGQRYSVDSTYGGGGEDIFQKSNHAFEKAVSLDPNRVMAASSLITNRVERGDLGRAFDAARDLVRRRPQSADAHFALSYVYRYAGMLPESIQECNAARQGDPGNFAFRSCAWSFVGAGKTDRALDFIQLDPGSEWAAWVTPYAKLAAGNVTEARADAKNMAKAPYYHRDLMEACTAPQRPSDLSRIVREAESSVMIEPDAEAWYHVGALMAYCGQSEPALRLLKAAVQQNYCAYSALLDDPLLKNLRKETAFNRILTAASNRQTLLKQGRSKIHFELNLSMSNFTRRDLFVHPQPSLPPRTLLLWQQAILREPPAGKDASINLSAGGATPIPRSMSSRNTGPRWTSRRRPDEAGRIGDPSPPRLICTMGYGGGGDIRMLSTASKIMRRWNRPSVPTFPWRRRRASQT